MDREGRMVVLSLVLGLSEQDDFANIPDLQATGNQQNQNSQGDKRYEEETGVSVAANSERKESLVKRLTSLPLRVQGLCKVPTAQPSARLVQQVPLLVLVIHLSGSSNISCLEPLIARCLLKRGVGISFLHLFFLVYTMLGTYVSIIPSLCISLQLHPILCLFPVSITGICGLALLELSLMETRGGRCSGLRMVSLTRSATIYTE